MNILTEENLDVVFALKIGIRENRHFCFTKCFGVLIRIFGGDLFGNTFFLLQNEKRHIILRSDVYLADGVKTDLRGQLMVKMFLRCQGNIFRGFDWLRQDLW